MVSLRFGTPADWILTHNIEIHKLLGSEPWPEQLLEFSTLLAKPLPGWIRTGPYPFTSPQSSQILPALQKQHTSIPVADASSMPESDSVANVFDLILSSVVQAQSLSDGETRERLSLWLFYIGALGKAFCPGAISFGSWFALPRARDHPFIEIEPMYGYADLLVSHEICVGAPMLPMLKDETGDIGELVAMTRGNMEVAKWIRSEDSSDCYNADVTGYGTESEVQHSTSTFSVDKVDTVSNEHSMLFDSNPADKSVSTIDEFPSDIHFLWQHQNTVVVPFICLAHGDNVPAMLSSALYQRKALGINEPVVGLELSTDNKRVHLVFGWLDEQSNHLSNLPTAHICHREYSYNLSDPFSAISIAQFLSNLSISASRVQNAVSTSIATCFSDPIFEWRSPLFHSGLVLEEPGVAEWIETQKSTLPPSNPPFAMSEQTKSTEERSKSKKSQSKLSNSHSVITIDDPESPEKPSPGNFQDDRLMFPFGNYDFKKESQFIRDYREKCKLYQDTVSFICPEWDNEIPCVDGAVEMLRDALLGAIEKRKTLSLPTALTNPEVVRAVAQNLSALLHAAVNSYNKVAHTAENNSLEADHRHDWDQMIKIFIGANFKNVFTGFERTLNLSLNKAISLSENLGHVKYLKTHIEIALKHSLHCRGEETALSESLDPEAKAEQIVWDGYTDAAQRLTNFLERRRSKEFFYYDIKRRSKSEAHDATCDTVSFIVWKDFWSNLGITDPKAAWKVHFQLIDPSEHAKKNDLSLTPDTTTTTFNEHWTRTASGALPAKLDTVKSARSLFDTASPTPVAGNGSDPTTIEAHLPHTLKESDIIDPHRDLILALFFVEYKKHGDIAGYQASNQLRTCVDSACRFWEALGFTEVVVWGLTVVDNFSVLSMSWLSKPVVEDVQDAGNIICSLERNIQKFDLTQPIQVYHFATVLVRIGQQMEKFKELVDSRKPTILKSLQAALNDEDEKKVNQYAWSKAWQNASATTVALSSLAE